MSPVNMDPDEVRIRRRKKAILGSMDEVRRRALPICPEVEGAFSIDREWTDINVLITSTYDSSEQDECLALGAALWLLDRIRENGGLQEAFELLPRDTYALESLNLPVIYDPRI